MIEKERTERRVNQDDLMVVIRQLKDDIALLSQQFHDHRIEEDSRLEKAIETLMNKSFPNGDAVGHCTAHHAYIQAAVDRAEFWKKLLFELTKYGVIGLLGWLALIVWTGFLKGPKP